MDPISEDVDAHPDPCRDNPPADFYSPRSSFISNASFCGFVDIDLDIHFKHISLTKTCKTYIDKDFKGDQYLDIGIDVYDCKEFIQVPRALGDRRRFKLNCMSQYRFEADEEFLQTLTEKSLIFKLFVINERREKCLSEANLYFGDLLDVADKRVDGSILFSSAIIDSTDNIACLELWYEFRCNKDEVLELLTKVDKNQAKLSTLRPADPEAGDFLRAKTSEIELINVVNFEPCPPRDASFQTLNLDAENSTPELSVTVVKLYFIDGSTPLKNDSIQHVYVEYDFLRQNGPEMETPFSVPIGTLRRPSEFNWTKTFDFNVQTNYEHCRLLMNILKRKEFVRFTVISEPIEVFGMKVQMCEEVGYAEVLLLEIIKLQGNVDRYQYEIFDAHNPMSVIGHMTIEFEGILALKNLVASFTTPKTYYECNVFG